MPFIPVQWARQTVEGRQDASDGSRLVNFYAVNPVSPEDVKSKVIIYSAPGYSKWAAINGKPYLTIRPGTSIQGLLAIDSPVFGKRLFAVVGDGAQLAEIKAEDYTGSSYVVPNDRIYQITTELDERISGPARMVTDGRHVMICGKNRPYIYEFGSDSPGFKAVFAPTPDDAAATLPDEEWVDCLWSDGYYILLARGGQIFHSLLNSVQFDQLDFASAEAKPDGIVGGAVFNRRLYIFGTQSIEQWYNAGTTFFAYTRDNSMVFDIGAASRDSIQVNEEAVFFLSSDGIVYAMIGTAIRRVSHEGVEYDIAKSNPSRARAWTYTEEGHRFYSLTIISDADNGEGWEQAPGGEYRKNWTLDTTTGFWHERTLTSVLCAANFEGANLIGTDVSEYAYELDLDVGTADGEAIRREAISPVVSNDQMRIQCHSFEIDLARKARFGDTDTCVMTFSDDEKETFSKPKARRCKQSRVRWNALGQFRNRHFSLVTEALARCDIVGAYVQIRLLRN